LRREKLRSFINERCIARAPKGSKEMTSLTKGEYYWWQFYLREAILVPEHLDFIAQQFWHTFLPLYKQRPFQLAGLEQASIPILTALLIYGAAAFELPISAFTVRKEYKAHGKGNIIEGRPNNKLPVVFVDDLTSPQHDAFWHCVREFNRAGLRLYPRAFVLVRKQYLADPPQIVTSHGTITIEGIFTLNDFALTFEDYQALRSPP
jgi:orotate phosphoribosyltransferase